MGESDIDTSDDDSSDQEVANLCLIAKEEKNDEVMNLTPLMNYKISMRNCMRNH